MEQRPGLREENIPPDTDRTGETQSRENRRPNPQHNQGSPGQRRLLQGTEKRDGHNEIEEEDGDAGIDKNPASSFVINTLQSQRAVKKSSEGLHETTPYEAVWLAWRFFLRSSSASSAGIGLEK